MFHLKNSLNRMMSSTVVASIGFAAFLYGASPASAQVLGTAQSYAILGGSAVTAAPPLSTINGSVGVDPGTSITGAANMNVLAPFGTFINGPAIQARADTTALFNSSALAPAGGSAITANLSTDGPTANGHYTAGKYSLASGTAIIPTSITLDGPGIYIFSLNSDITTSVGSTVILNGADPCTVFWRVPTLATLNGDNFPGTVVAGAGITLGTNAILTGRALAGTLVSLAGGNNVGGCSAAAVATPTLGTVASPGVTLGAPIFDTATLSGGAAPTGTITFNLYGPNDPICDSVSKFTSVVTVNGNGTYTSASFTPLVIGTYRWRAGYIGDTNNAAFLTACADVSESVIVSAVLPPASAGVPTLSGWGLMTLMVLVVLASIYRLRKL